MSELSGREAEIGKYVRAYAGTGYGMGAARKADATDDLAALPVRGAYLDVGCGRGEMLFVAEELGYRPVKGVEPVPALTFGTRVVPGRVHALPFADDAFDVASLFDVLEHLLPEDDEAACRELRRVARRHVLLTANNLPSRLTDGTELHVNIRPYDEWQRLIEIWFAGAAVTRLGDRRFSSAAWRIDL